MLAKLSQWISFTKKYLILLVVMPLLILAQLPATLSTDSATSMTFNSLGTISTNSLRTISTSNAANLAPMFQGGTCYWGEYNLYNKIYYSNHNQADQIAFKDDNVLHDGHSSIRLEQQNNVNKYREVNFKWISVSPGQHILMKVWIKTNALTEGSGRGAIVGYDVYSKTHRILEVHPCTPQTAIWNIVNEIPVQGGVPNYIPYGSNWTQIIFDIIIPSNYYTHDDFGNSIPSQQISGIIPWLGATWNGQSNYPTVWFADSELCINP